ncbi:MAG: glycosyl hydrolase [Victivallaceae bacterium]|nr:glycosyl hydrolase [Victivallaceae bacterium]
MSADPGKPGQMLVDLQCAYSASGTDDIARFKHLMQGIGWEFEPNAQTDAGLKKLGMKRIRCINVDPLRGSYDANGKFIVAEDNPRFNAHIKTCRSIGAIPHIIIGLHMPKELVSTVTPSGENGKTAFGMTRNLRVGPNDFRLYRNYWIAFFEHVVITKGVDNAVFEIFNEPDIGGIITPTAPKPANGSAALYKDMFDLYKEIMAARREFEQLHPGKKLTVGGPALAWCYTFGFGPFNWSARFVRDCAEAKCPPDFIGVHFYGNVSELDGAGTSFYPTYREQVRALAGQRDKYLPGVPLQINEWGPSYYVDNSVSGQFNSTIVGAAWSLEYLHESLDLPVASMLYLTTTDLAKPRKSDGKRENVFGWCSLWLSSSLYPAMIPKVQYHAFEMVSRLRGERVLANKVGNVSVLAARGDNEVQLLLWNFKVDAPETGKVIDLTKPEKLDIVFRHAGEFFKSGRVAVKSETLSADSGDVVSVYLKSGKVDPAAAIPAPARFSEAAVENNILKITASIPKSGIQLVTIVDK